MTFRGQLRHLLTMAAIWAVVAVQGCHTGAGESMKKCDSGTNRIRLEHVALNVGDPVGMAKWYCSNLGMKILREGPAPVNGRFLADSDGNMMLEVYTNPPDAVPDYGSMDPLCLHIAFMVEDIVGIKDKLTAAGATVVEDVSTTAGGDEILMMRDPWGVPIQFVKRSEPMLGHR